MLDAVRFSGGTAAVELLQAVEILQELNATGARKIPDIVLRGQRAAGRGATRQSGVGLKKTDPAQPGRMPAAVDDA